MILEKAQQLQKEGKTVEALLFINGAPALDSSDGAASKVSALEVKLLGEYVDNKIEAGKLEDALEKLREHKGESFEPSKSEKDRGLQKLAAKVYNAMYDTMGLAKPHRDAVRQEWKLAGVHRRVIEGSIAGKRFNAAESQIGRHDAAFGDTAEGKQNVEELTKKLEQARSEE